MENPLNYGGVVGNGAFCNRAQELADLQQIMGSAGRCFVYAERRIGKTSLIRQYLPVYIDLWPTDGSASFATTTARSLTLDSETKAGRLLELAKALFGRLSPSVSVDDRGQPSVGFGLESIAAKKAGPPGSAGSSLGAALDPTTRESEKKR